MEFDSNVVARRTMLRAGLGFVAAAGIAPVLAGTAVAAPPGQADVDRAMKDALAKVRSGEVSANGWEIEKGADIGGAIWTRDVEGTGLAVALRIGAAQTVLRHVIRRYHYRVDTLRAGDVVGYLAKDKRLPDYQSNHASGTAIDIRPGWYPVGSLELLGVQRTQIRAIVDECRGLVAWGGDFKVPDEAHFQISVGPQDPRLAELADAIKRWKY